MTIWKKNVEVSRTRTLITMPFPFRIIHVGAQHGILHLWAEVEENNPVTVTRLLVVVGTGWERPPGNLTHLGSALCGPFMWHVYEEVAE